MLNKKVIQRLFIGFFVVVDCFQLQAQNKSSDIVHIKVNPDIVISHISPDFIGFGYETAAVAQSGFFSPENKTMIQLYRNLSSRGLIRIGGIISDHTKYEPNGDAVVSTQKGVTVINRKNLINLGKFARATGWKVMWGLNLQTGSKNEAVTEAEAVEKALGSRLQSFEIGNEVDFFPKFRGNHKAYYKSFLEYKAALREKLPHSPFSGPDIAQPEGHMDWVKNFVHEQGDDIKLLTVHYYRGGARNPTLTLEKLLTTDQVWQEYLKKLQQISVNNHLPYRNNEVNSFSGGGKAGVSDTFGSALWCLDYMYMLASYGCNGVNIETDVNQLGWISHYSPIVHDSTGKCSVRPDYYGMLAFALGGHGNLVKLSKSKTNINVSAYATKSKANGLWVTIINKDFSYDAMVSISLPEGYSKAHIYRLTAPSIYSKDHVTLSGSKVTDSGKLTPMKPRREVVTKGAEQITVPFASAAIIHFTH